MRFALLTMLLLGACDGGGKTAADAKLLIDSPPVAIDAPMIDAPMIDAMVDAAPPSMEIMTACMHACDAFATCAMEPPDTTCYSECGADLGDCSMQQVMDVDTCSQGACNALESCLMLITCIQG